MNMHELASLALQRTRELFDTLTLPAPLDEATDLLLGEIRARLRYLTDVGLGYLTAARCSASTSPPRSVPR